MGYHVCEGLCWLILSALRCVAFCFSDLVVPIDDFSHVALRGSEKQGCHFAASSNWRMDSPHPGPPYPVLELFLEDKCRQVVSIDSINGYQVSWGVVRRQDCPNFWAAYCSLKQGDNKILSQYETFKDYSMEEAYVRCLELVESVKKDYGL